MFAGCGLSDDVFGIEVSLYLRFSAFPLKLCVRMDYFVAPLTSANCNGF
jgi:hypothetical protein